MKHLIFPIALLLATSAAAQDYATRATDSLPDTAALSALILDRDLIYFDDGTSRYSADGTYTWTYSKANGGGIWEGRHTITDNIVCITFATGMERCDMFVTSGDRLTLLTADGDRYPIREIRVP
ncbi:hypothetical protein [Pseudooctadecabacter sp.]|uniref:hypothetical protein n=1 Tax=Pseudooctadecabacter sp. TaxID=1966338 RepID=UPI0035C804F0